MATESPAGVKFNIGHVLCIDIVGYSKLLITEQSDQIQTLKEIVRGTEQVRIAETEGKLLRLPTGDGGALVFKNHLEAPVLCALEIAKALQSHPEIRVRMGVHSGPVNEVTDLNGQSNAAGAGINIAQRVMDCGDAGHILLSKRVADDLEQYPQWRSRLQELGEFEVKHGARVSVVNLFTDEVGNSVVPARLSETSKTVRSSGQRLSPFQSALIFILILLICLGIPALIFTPAILKSRRLSESNASTSRAASGTASATDQKSIAVLPFVNLSADKNDEYLSDGMTEELLNVLTKVKGLHVPGRSASFAFKGKNEDNIFRKVGEQLHVNAVLEGSVRKAGDKLRITAQLIKVSDGFHLWSETYDGDMKDILAMQSDVAQRVVSALEVQLGVEEARALTKKPTENAEAYRLYLLGRYHFGKFTRIGWTNAIHYFEQSLQVDPTYALAYCGLADTYGWAGGQIMPGRDAWSKEKELALKALALDPNLAEAHLSLGVAFFSALDFEGSVNEIKRALQLAPTLALAHDQYGWTFMADHRFDEAIASSKKALELDPLNLLLNTDCGFFLQWARRYDEAIVQLRKTLELDPNNPLARQTLGWCLHWKGKPAEALTEFQKAATLDDLPWYKGSLGHAYAAAGDRAKAEQILRDLDELAKNQYVSPACRASVYLGLGEKGKALDWLEKAGEDRDPLLWWNTDQLYDSVRKEPRFKAILEKSGAKQ